MNNATVELITGLAHALAWPVTVLIVVLSLRSKIGELLLRVRSFEHGDTKLNFQDELHAISEVSDVPAVAERASNGEDWAKPLGQIRTLADAAPRQAVLNAWNQLMDTAVGLAHDHGITPSEQELNTPKHLAERLRSQGFIDAQTCDALVSMRLLRNKVAHANNMPVTTKDALSFLDMVASLMRTLTQSRRAAPTQSR